MTAEDWIKLLIQSNVVAAIVVGLFGLLTLWFGLGKFRSEKWWEKKATAYAAAIEALHGMYDLSLARVEAIEAYEDIADDRLVALQAANIAGLNEVRKGASIGEFILSKSAASILRSVLKEFDKMEEPTLHAFYDSRATVLSDAIKKMTDEAKRDLKTR
jgi:hypothetical protein